MAEEATIIGKATDIWGDAWDVREARPTDHGFDVLLGWPIGIPRGKGGSGGPRLIVTPELAAYMESRRYPARGVHLPIARTTIKRLRGILGHQWYVDHTEWWAERADELADTPAELFAKRHNVAAHQVVGARLALFGPRLRPNGWWRAPDVAAILLQDSPASIAAEQLGISVSSVRRLRAALRERLQPPRQAGSAPVIPRRVAGRASFYLTKKELAYAAEKLESGMSRAAVADALGVDPGTIGYNIKVGRLPASRSAEHTASRREAVVAAVRGGATYQRAAQDHNVAFATARKWCLLAGVKSKDTRS